MHIVETGYDPHNFLK